MINLDFRCVAKNSLGNSDGSISLYGRGRGEGVPELIGLFRDRATNTTNNCINNNINH